MRAAWVGLLSLLASTAWAGNTFTGNQLVKSNSGYFIFDTGHADWMFDCSCPANFGGPSRTIHPSPVNGGPTTRTANPIQAVPGHSGCAIFDSNSDGLGDFNFEFEPGSLHDIGTWTLPCSCTMVNIAYCVSCGTNACGVCCDLSGVVADPSPTTFVLTVFNSPPTASISTSPAAPAWNSSVTLHSGGNDPDHGTSGLQYHWNITAHPSGTALSSTTVSDPTIHFTSEHDIGHWAFSLDVDDQEGERVSTSHAFDVPNVPPTLSISPPSPITIDALEDIAMTAAATDPDGGGNPSVVWDLAVTPPGASHAPQSHYATGDTFTPIPTGKHDVGDWQINCTATDNEGPSATPPGVVTNNVVVHVRNLPPTVNISGAPQISVGDTVHAETTPDTDPYGDALQFQWEVVQVPHSAGVPLHTILSTSATLDMPTSAADAGTWIFKLTATESGVAPTATPSPVVTATYTVLVDALPTADIAISASGPVIAGNPPTISSASFPLTLDASGSIDPDSPCPSDPNHCHDTTTPPATVSPGIVAYVWTLTDVSPELFSHYPLGRVDEVFGIDGTSATVVFHALDLLPGQYTFQVEVTDGEGHTDTATQSVLILEVNTPPVAQVSAPARYLLGLAGLTSDIVLTGANSFDLDNILTGGVLGPGLGITDYQWQVTPPPGCTPPPIPSGAGAGTFTLYAAGTTPPNACLGSWDIKLTVGDDDSPQLHGSANTFLIIGNCPTALCIDDPTTAIPVAVDFSDRTDVTIAYHLDSTVYEDPTYVFGAFTRLDIFDDASPALPFYTSFDPNALASDKGSFLTFNWNGTGNDGTLPSPGTYTVTITIDGSGLSAGPFSTSQPTSIYIAVANLIIQPTSDRYVDWTALDAGTTALHFNYDVGGGTTIDQLHWRVRDAADTVVFESDTPVANSGTVQWDGKVAGITLASGDYTFELEALRAGASLGKSPRYDFTLYKLGLKPTTAAPTPLSLLVNSDDDDLNNTADLTQSPAAAGEDDLISVDVTFDPAVPGTLVLSSSVMPAPFKVWTAADKTTEIVLPKTYTLPGDTVPATVFIEGTSSAAATLTATLTPTSTGAALPAKTLQLNMIEIAAMNDTNGDFVPDTATLFVRVGLWDFAFRLVADAFGAIGTLFNEQDDVRMAATGNPENFIGRDSRRFYITVRDAARNTNAATAEEIPLGQFDWYTVAADRTTDDDHPAGNATLSLIENGPNTAAFASAAVMLVAGQVDRNQPTNSGIAAHAGAAAYNAANHRTRQVAGPDGFVVLRYQPTVAGSSQLSVKVPLFQRAPEERRVVSAHVFNFSQTSAAIAAIPAATVNQLNQVFTDRMTVMGFRTNIIFNAGTDVIDLPAASPVNLNMVGDFTGGFGTLAPSADQSALITAVRAVDPATAANADTIYIMYIGNFGNRGESFPDGWIPAGSPARNFTFTAGRSASIATTPAHEIIAHMLCNQTLTAAEAAGTQNGWAGGGHYGPTGNAANAQDTFNLCRNGTVDSSPMAVTDSLRIWDDAPTHVFQQITRARTAARYLKMP